MSDRPTARMAAGRTASQMPAPLVLQRYALQRRLGTGAFGTVWMARDEHLERDVAVKILARELVVGGRFEREARAAARLSHAGIVTLYEAAVDDEGAYLVSELVHGETLGALLADGRLSDRDIVEIGIALCDALSHAHEQGVVHRDVKPSNVLVPERTNGRGRAGPAAKLTDFGVARVVDSDSLTITGDVVGTLAYMAPEQAAGLEAGEAADLYSLALVLYEALTGVNPVRSANSARRLAYLPPLRRQRRDLPSALGRAIDTALRPRVDERGTVGDLREGLAAAVQSVGEEPGIVTGALHPRRFDDDQDAGTRRLWGPRPAADGAPAALPEPDPSRLIWQARAIAAAAAAATAAWTGHLLLAGAHHPLAWAGGNSLALVALIAAGLTLLVPRLAWPAIAAYLCATAAIAGHAGAATLVAVGALVPMVLMPAAPTLWPVSAAAPALGLIGLAGGFPALGGYAHTPWRRAMLGATGWLWLALAGPLAARRLYLPRPHAIGARHHWWGSVTGAAEHVLTPLWHTGVLAPAVVWAAAAIIAPWMVSGRSLLLDALRAALWSAAVTAATALAVLADHGSHHSSAAPTAVAGAVAAALLALAPAIINHVRRALRTP